MQSGATIGGAVIENHDRFDGCRTARNYRLKNLALLARQARDTIIIWSGVHRMLAVAGFSTVRPAQSNCADLPDQVPRGGLAVFRAALTYRREPFFSLFRPTQNLNYNFWR
jgi:hypothetical protein